MVSLQPEELNISSSAHLVVTSFLRFCLKRPLFSLNYWRVILTEYRILGYLFHFHNFNDVLIVFWLALFLMRNQWISDLSSLLCTPFPHLNFFSSSLVFSNLIMMCIVKTDSFLQVVLLGVCGAPWICELQFPSSLEHFQPLILKRFFLCFPFSVLDSNNTHYTACYCPTDNWCSVLFLCFP